HFLKIVPVILDPSVPPAHIHAVADFFVHDVPDFLGWCERPRARIPCLYPADVISARDPADFLAKLPAADRAVFECLVADRTALAAGARLQVAHKVRALGSNIDAAACAERGVAVVCLHRHVNVAVAEQCGPLMLALAKRLSALDGLVDRAALAAEGY